MSSKKFIFYWSGVDRLGLSKQGQITAKDKQDALQQLRQKEVIVRSIVKKSVSLNLLAKKNIHARDIRVFSHHMATALAAGLSVIQSLELLQGGEKNTKLQPICNEIQQDIHSGLLLAEALGKHPAVFDRLFCHLIAIGENAGTLDTMFSNIARYLEKMEQIKKRIQKTTAYPLMMLLIACLISLGLLCFVVPQFETLFRQFGAELPSATVCLIHLSHWMKVHWLSLCLGVYLNIVLIRYGYHHSRGFKKFTQRMMLHCPILGLMIQHTIISAMANTLAITYKAGIPLVDALKSASLVTNNLIYQESMMDAHHALTQGESLHLAIQETGLFTEFVIQMIKLGEESSTLEQRFYQIATYYEGLVEHTIHQFSTLLGPMLMALLGLLMGGLILAMYTPILKLGAVVS